jgi:hypothetical protein
MKKFLDNTNLVIFLQNKYYLNSMFNIIYYSKKKKKSDDDDDSISGFEDIRLNSKKIVLETKKVFIKQPKPTITITKKPKNESPEIA